MFDNIYKLVGVPVITVQLRYNGWVTEMQEEDKVGPGAACCCCLCLCCCCHQAVLLVRTCKQCQRYNPLH